MDLAIERIHDVVVVRLPYEELDASNASELKRDLTALLETESRIVFDLSQLRFVDSSGLGAFLSCLRRVNARGGDLKLCCLSRPVRAVFELVRMHRIFDIYATRDEATRAFAPSPETTAAS